MNDPKLQDHIYINDDEQITFCAGKIFTYGEFQAIANERQIVLSVKPFSETESFDTLN